MFLVLYGMSVTLISFLISVERKKKNSVKLRIYKGPML